MRVLRSRATGSSGAEPLRGTHVVSRGRIGSAALLGERDGAFGQTLEDQVVERALAHEVDRRLDAVPGEAGSTTRCAL